MKNSFVIQILLLNIFILMEDRGDCYRLMGVGTAGQQQPGDEEDHNSPKIYRASNMDLFAPTNWNPPDSLEFSEFGTTTPTFEEERPTNKAPNEMRSFAGNHSPGNMKHIFYVTPAYRPEASRTSTVMKFDNIDRFTPGEAVASHKLRKGSHQGHHQLPDDNVGTIHLSSFPPNNNVYPQISQEGQFSPSIGIPKAVSSTSDEVSIDFPSLNEPNNHSDTKWIEYANYPVFSGTNNSTDLEEDDDHYGGGHELMIYPNGIEHDDKHFPAMQYPPTTQDHHETVYDSITVDGGEDDLHHHQHHHHVDDTIPKYYVQQHYGVEHHPRPEILISHHPESAPKLPPEGRVKKYSYFYIGRKLWYIPLYFTVWFSFYVLWLILKSIARHKVNIPNHYVNRRSLLMPDVNVWQRNHTNNLDQQTATIMHQIDDFKVKFHGDGETAFTEGPSSYHRRP